MAYQGLTARNEEFSKIAVINFFFSVLKKTPVSSCLRFRGAIFALSAAFRIYIFFSRQEVDEQLYYPQGTSQPAAK